MTDKTKHSDYPKIIGRIKTKDEADTLADELDLLLESVYESSGKAFGESLKDKVRAWVASAINDEIGQGARNDELLNNLKEELDNLETIKLNLAFDPTSESIEKIHNWVLTNLGPGIIMELTQNTSVLAGAVIIHKGEYRDYTLRKLVTDDIEKNSTKIAAQLTKSQTSSDKTPVAAT